MDHIFSLIEMDSSNGRIKVSITESTMMQILHNAMDKAYRKVKSKNGALERLNEISKFDELAVIQLEGCLKFVQEETENYVLESSHEVLLEDLTEIRDRLQGLLKEVELAISDRDKELMERLGNELKLTKALEISENELDSLHADLKLKQRKSEGIEELFLSNQASTDNGDREGEFRELKNSVDQKVWNIQQQLGPNYQLRDEERSQGIDNKKIEQMGSDIGILKETLDLAFRKMQNAIFLSELGPIEHQWMWNIERGTAAIVIKGSLKDFRENFEEEVKKIEMQDEIPVKSLKSKGSLKAKGRRLSEGESFGNSSNFFLKVEEASTIKQPCDEDSDDDGSHYVAKMIKNHESIIQRKSEELNLLTLELLREKTCPPHRREKDSVNPKRRIQEVIVSLESLINWNPGMGDIFGDSRRDCEVEKHLEEIRDEWNKKTESDTIGVQSREEKYDIMFRKAMKDLDSAHNSRAADYQNAKAESNCLEDLKFRDLGNLESMLKGDVFTFLLQEILREWNENIESYQSISALGEDLCFIVFGETVRDSMNIANYALSKLQEIKVHDSFNYDFQFSN
ncbi:hypothetical protein CRYUN_Cryun41cG0035100 [Craigia yunnanensis]